ncbi:unnamed protein product [Lymnaea stagnalis]|uniref:Uncharacterized protein n=1 Tax=Lymnaea stagnalis TaxID=6523 RepID=A0AAV2HIN5_LYMST
MMKLSSCLRNLALSCVLLIALVQCQPTDLEDRDINFDDEAELSERFAEETGAGALAKESRDVVAEVDRRHWFNAERGAEKRQEKNKKLEIFKTIVNAIAKWAKNSANSAPSAEGGR